MPKRKQPSLQIPSAQSEDQPATRKMLYLVRDELKGDIRSLEAKIESRFQSMESSHARFQILMEEQNSNNRIVLEGLQALWQRQDKIEKGFY